MKLILAVAVVIITTLIYHTPRSLSRTILKAMASVVVVVLVVEERDSETLDVGEEPCRSFALKVIEDVLAIAPVKVLPLAVIDLLVNLPEMGRVCLFWHKLCFDGGFERLFGWCCRGHGCLFEGFETVLCDGISGEANRFHPLAGKNDVGVGVELVAQVA